MYAVKWAQKNIKVTLFIEIINWPGISQMLKSSE